MKALQQIVNYGIQKYRIVNCFTKLLTHRMPHVGPVRQTEKHNGPDKETSKRKLVALMEKSEETESIPVSISRLLSSLGPK